MISLSFLKSFGQTPSNDPHWKLVWQDDFNTLNTAIWKVANNFDHYSGDPNKTFIQGEPQVYTDRSDNVFVSNGNLVLRLKNETYNCPSSALNEYGCSREARYGVSYNYTSGYVETQQAYNTQYGFIESRILLPYGVGFWPAFWTFKGDGVTGSNAAEIDIFEMIGDLPSTVFTTNIHKVYPDDHYSTGLMSSYENTYHNYAVEWSPSRIIWYIDGYPVRLFPNHGIIDPVKIILNLAIQPNHNPSSPFPSDMLIDYVKVYELDKDCNDFINSYNYDFSSYNNKVKNFIKIGEGGGNNSLAVGQDVTLRASQFIEFTSDFYVPLGAALYVDANDDCSTDISTECTQTFNPCTYDFSNYDNLVKKIIKLGNNGCNITITPTTNNIILHATTDQIILNSGVIITSTPGKYVELKIVPCN